MMVLWPITVTAITNWATEGGGQWHFVTKYDWAMCS